MKILLSLLILLFIPFLSLYAQKKEVLDKQFLLKQLLTHQKGVCSCAIKYHQTLNNFASISGRLNAKIDTTRYFFQFGKVYQQIGGHQPPTKNKDN